MLHEYRQLYSLEKKQRKFTQTCRRMMKKDLILRQTEELDRPLPEHKN